MATLTTYRRTLAPLLGVFEQGTADASGSTTSALLCTTGLASGARLKSSAWTASLFNGKWVYMPGAASDDRSRLVKPDDGYDPTTGALAVDQAYSADPDTLSDRTFEITSLFSGPDLNALVNAALQKVFVVRDLTFTVAGDNVRKHQVNASASWLRSWTWIYQLGHLQTGESWAGTATLAATDPYRRVKHGAGYDLGDQVWVEGPQLGWRTTDTVYARCACRAYDDCKPSAGAFGDQSGLSLETDEAPVDATWLAWVAIAEAKNRLDHLESIGQATEDAMRSRAMASARVSELTRRYWTEPARTFRPAMTYVGPTMARRGGRRW